MDYNSFDSWVAGFWEGEGSICKRRHIGYCISICQSIDKKRNVESTMKKIQRTYGGHISIRDMSKYKPNYKPRVEWVLIRRDDVINFIKTIYPYCYIRQRDLETCLIYFETNPSLKWNKIIDLEKVKRLLNVGKTYKEIGKIFNVSSATIYRHYNDKINYYYNYQKKCLNA